LARASACHAEGRGFESHHPLSEEPLVADDKIRCARCNEFIFSDALWDLDHLPAGDRVPSHRRCNRQTMLHRNPQRWVSREWRGLALERGA
jgi:hypothetical protein